MSDIRVIFKPEGVKDVIAGMRQITREAESTSNALDRRGGFVNLFNPEQPKQFNTALTGALATARRLIPVLGFTGAVAGMVSLGRASLQTAQDIAKVRQQFSLTAEEVSTLNFLARANEATNGDVERGLKGLANSQRELRAGAEETVAAYADLGLTAKDFIGLNLAQSFELIAKRMDGIDPNRLQLDAILGRDARRLLPALNDLAQKGFAGVRKEAEAAGQVLRSDVPDAAKVLSDELQRSRENVGGLANDLIRKLSPVLTAVAQGFNRLAATARAALSGDFVEAMRLQVDGFLRLIGARRDQPGQARRPAQQRPDGAVDEAARNRAIEVSRKQSEEQIKLLNDQNRRRKELAEAAIEGERRVAEARTAGASNQLRASQELLDAETKAIRDRVQLTAESARTEESIVRAKYEAEIAAAQQASATTAGFEARKVAIDRQFAQDRARIAQAYYNELRRLEADALAQFKASKEQQKALEDELRGIRRSAADLAFEGRIAQSGPATQAIEREARAQELIKQLKEAADRGQLDRARQLRAEIEGQARAIAGLDTAFAGEAGQRVLAAANAIFEQVIAKQQEIEKQREAASQRALTSIQSQIALVEQKITELNAKPVNLKLVVGDQELQSLTRSIQEQLSRTPFQIAVSPVVSGGGAPRFDTGGMVPGSAPSARADNVIARVTSGEFVEPVAAVRKYGVPFMEAVRTLRFPAFADGGMVGGGTTTAAGGGEHTTMHLNINGRRSTVFGPRDELARLAASLKELSNG